MKKLRDGCEREGKWEGGKEERREGGREGGERQGDRNLKCTIVLQSTCLFTFCRNEPSTWNRPVETCDPPRDSHEL